jgi:hypothetical protein
MGLDMFLQVRQPVTEFYEPPASINDKSLSTKITELVGSPFKATMVVGEAAYWRKANAIHGWFVRNVQGGIDDCEEYEVSLDQLRSLYADVCAVLKDTSKANDLLPPTKGFFFGSTEVDDYYIEDLNFTKDQLEKIFAASAGKPWRFTYRSSW